VGAWLRERGTTVSAFYVSNVEQYLFRPVNKTVAFYDNVAALPLDHASVLVRSGFAGSALMAANPFTPPNDSIARLFIEHQRRPAVATTPPAALCPALDYLSAFKRGLVVVYADAEKCVR
jgi:hypothetical protein